LCQIRRWWWRGAHAPLPVLDPRFGLLSPTSCLLTLLGESESRGRSETKDPSARHSRCRLTPSDLPAAFGAEELLAGPLPLSEELGATEGALGPTSAGWGPPTGAPGIWIPRWVSQPPVWQIVTPLSSRVGSRASTVDRNPGLSQSDEIPWGGI
jgi:hypothetical protein